MKRKEGSEQRNRDPRGLPWEPAGAWWARADPGDSKDLVGKGEGHGFCSSPVAGPQDDGTCRDQLRSTPGMAHRK